MVADRADGEEDGDRNRPDPQRRPQEPEAPGAGVEDVAGIDREERDRAAEKHGEEVERDRAEDDLLMPDVAEAGDHTPSSFRARTSVR